MASCCCSGEDLGDDVFSIPESEGTEGTFGDLGYDLMTFDEYVLVLCSADDI